MPLNRINQLVPQEHSAQASGNGQTPVNWNWRSSKVSGRAVSASEAAEREFLTQELAKARERIGELTRSQVDLTGTVARLTELASTDVMTGLNNRRRFDEALQANFALAMRQRSMLSVIMLDVDRFKSYNDTYGHSAGDAVLCVVSEQLLHFCSNYDVAARIGGEEFAVLLPTADESLAMILAETIRSAIETQPWEHRLVTASFGVATLGPETKEPSDLLREADRALYVSKGCGRNRVTHHRELLCDATTASVSTAEEGEPQPADGFEAGPIVGSSPTVRTVRALTANPELEPSSSIADSPRPRQPQSPVPVAMNSFDSFLQGLRDVAKA